MFVMFVLLSLALTNFGSPILQPLIFSLKFLFGTYPFCVYVRMYVRSESAVLLLCASYILV